MAESTTPVLIAGGLTVLNRNIFNDEPWDWRIPIATGIAVGMFALLEKPFPGMAKALAWTAVATIVLARVDPKVPSVAESGLAWFNRMSA